MPASAIPITAQHQPNLIRFTIVLIENLSPKLWLSLFVSFATTRVGEIHFNGTLDVGKSQAGKSDAPVKESERLKGSQRFNERANRSALNGTFNRKEHNTFRKHK
jgi:hypothetical protein